MQPPPLDSPHHVSLLPPFPPFLPFFIKRGMGRLQVRLNQGTAWLDAFFSHPSSLKSLVQQDSSPSPPQLCSTSPPWELPFPSYWSQPYPLAQAPLTTFRKPSSDAGGLQKTPLCLCWTRMSFLGLSVDSWHPEQENNGIM